MASIPGWAYLIVGILVAGYARFIQSKGGAIMGLFFWIGVVFVVIGVFKMLLNYMTKQKETPRQNSPLSGSASGLTCVRCNARLHEKSRYCNWCGTKV